MSRRRARKWGAHVTRGGVATLAWLEKQDLSIPEFADTIGEPHGINRVLLQRNVRGDQQSVTVEFAKAMQDATDGAIEMQWWAEEAAVPVEQDATGAEDA